MIHSHTAVRRGIDPGFIALQRAKGTPDAAIARMGAWCLSDVQSVLNAPPVHAEERKPQPRQPLNAMTIPDVAEILIHIAQQYDISPADILGHSHAAEIVEPRHEAMAVVKELNRYTLAEMGELFNKTGEAVLYGFRRHYERIRTRGYGRDW